MNKFEDMCGLSHGYLYNLKGEVGSSKILKILATFPEINPVWLVTGAGDMFKTQNDQTNEYDIKNLVPELPIDAAAGFTDDLDRGVMPYNCEMLPRIPSIPRYDITIHVRGDSMEPTFLSGDRLAARKCYEIYEWGAPHVIDTTEGIYIKRIKDDTENITCISDNPDYPPFKIHKSCIRGIYKVIAVLRIC